MTSNSNVANFKDDFKSTDIIEIDITLNHTKAELEDFTKSSIRKTLVNTSTLRCDSKLVLDEDFAENTSFWMVICQTNLTSCRQITLINMTSRKRSEYLKTIYAAPQKHPVGLDYAMLQGGI